MRKKVLIIGLVLPEPQSSAAGTRMLQLVDLFLSEQYSVIFCSAAQPTAHSFPLETIGVQSVDILLNDGSFDRFVAGLQPDIVLFDRYVTEEQFGWRVAQAAPHALRILDTEDLHCLRIERGLSLRKGIPFEIDSLLRSEVAVREIAAIYRCDLSLMISQVEMDILTGLFALDPQQLHYLPFLYERREADAASPTPFGQRNGYMFIGNFHHPPNVDAVHQLKTEIWPRIRNLQPDAAIHIYGAYMPDKLLRLHDTTDGFLMEGRAEDVDAVMRSARLFLAPLRIGAGQKGKLAEAMRNGLPSVTTTIGAEGMSWDGSWGGAVTDDPQEFATAAVSLYTDATVWTSAQAIGMACFQELFDADAHRSAFVSRLRDTMGGLAAARDRNFVGRMLRHHTMATHRYLSKWIEEKHRPR